MLNSEGLSWSDIDTKVLIDSGHKLSESSLLFEKVEDDKIQEQIDKLKVQSEEKQVEPKEEEYMDFETFTKMDMRVATIKTAEKPEGSKKLLKLTLDLGNEERTVMSGIAEHYNPEEIIGHQVTLLANLAPRKIMGIESQGMILMAENDEGKLVFMQPSDQIENGAKIS
jgi:methionyl-tRNA synthetase